MKVSTIITPFSHTHSFTHSGLGDPHASVTVTKSVCHHNSTSSHTTRSTTNWVSKHNTHQSCVLLANIPFRSSAEFSYWSGLTFA